MYTHLWDESEETENEHESQKRMIHDMMTKDKNRFQMGRDGKEVQARGRGEGKKTVRGVKVI